jgi:PAS domain S-box-containing protein
MLIFDANGNLMAADFDQFIGKNFSHRPYFQEVLKHPDPDKLYISAPFKTGLGTWTMNISRAVLKPNGEFAGLIVAGLDPEEFSILLESVRYAPDMEVELAYQTGQIFVSLPPTREDKPQANQDETVSRFVQHHASGRTSDLLITGKAPGKQQMLALQTIHPAALNMTAPLMVSMHRDLDALYAPWHKKVQFIGGLFALLALLCVCSLYLNQRQRQQALREIEAASAAEQAALHLAERFREALDHVSSFIYMKDLEHRYVYANRPTLELFGVSAEQLPGSPDAQFFPPETVSRLKAVDEQVFSGQQTHEEIEVVATDGSRRVYLEVKTPIYDDAERKHICGLCGISTDITERKQNEEELERMVAARTAALAIAKEAAETANQAKTTFLATMSHELRTPLNAIMGFTSILLRKLSDPTQLDQLTKVEAASLQLRELIDRILDFSKIEADRRTLAREDFQPAVLLKKTYQQFSAKTSAKHLALHIEMPAELADVTVCGSPQHVEQILCNLLDNALKFTESGQITLGFNLQPSADENDPEGWQLRFAVSDTGIGIAPKDQARIFNSFEQVDGSASRHYSGAGLGLALCQQLVERMGGSIGVDSRPGEGSSFWFTVRVTR